MKDILDLSGKTAFVGGSTQGIGWAGAKIMAQLGANIVLAARNEERLIQRVQELSNTGNQTHTYLVVDYTDPETLKAKAEAALQGRDVHILIHNTGGPPAGLAVDADPSEFVAAFQTHLICNQILTQLCIPSMKESGYGRIINILSTSVKQPIPNLGVSNTIRGAVAQWAKTLANELGQYGITVNNILPGMTSTQRLTSIVSGRAEKQGKSVEEVENDLKATIPARRFGEPDELGYAIAFLASPAASYINGINLPVDGGRIGGL